MRWVLIFVALAAPGLACADDYVFYQNNDSISMRNVGGDISVRVCSFSSKSAYEFVCNGQNTLKWINSSNRWSDVFCKKGTNAALLNIVVREGSVGPANSAMVVRVSGVEVTQVQGADDRAAGDNNKCK